MSLTELDDAMPLEIDDLTLARAQRGDRRALARVIGCYQDRVAALAGRLLVAWEVPSSDVVQDVFIKVIRHLDRFDPAAGVKLSTWILTIATRTCLDCCRRQRRDGTAAAARRAAVEGVSGGTDPERAAATRELGQKVEAAMRGLPEDQRAVLVLRAYFDFDNREIAAALGIEEGTVKSRLSRARAALRPLRGDAEVGTHD